MQILTGNLNYLAILVAGIGAWMMGAAWYGVLGKQWMSALGKTKDELKMSAVPMVLSFVGDLIMAAAIALSTEVYTRGAPAIWPGLLVALLLWIGFVLTTITVNNAYAGRRFALTIIDAGHWLAAMLVAAAIIGAFG